MEFYHSTDKAEGEETKEAGDETKMERNEELIQALRDIEGEIRECFDGWDVAIKNGIHPVQIQDLDFWSCNIKAAIKELEDDYAEHLVTKGQREAKDRAAELEKGDEE